MNDLYERIQALSKGKGITIASLERECGLGNATIKKWGTSTPSVDRLSKVADYFNVSVDYLLGREPEQLNNVYFSFAKEAEKNGINPKDIQMAIDMIKKLRGE